MKKLRISAELQLPLDWIMLATVVYGARGSGKTCFGRVAAEEATKARQRFCGIDLKGDWSGLKSSADGRSEGIPVIIFGGDHADVPLEPDAGAFVGETVAKLEQSCILDFELLSKGKQIRFLAEFFEALYHHNREPLLLLLDEAQRYAPQKPGPDEARTLGAVQDLVKLGRKHGIGPVLFTQRGAGLSKEVSELCDMLVAFRTPGPLDQDRIKDWLDANTTKAQRDQVMSTLAGLETGTAVFASGHPDLKLFGVYNVRRPETFDSSATPKVGQRRAEPKKFAAPDLKEIREKMAAAIERQKADDPKAIRAKYEAEIKTLKSNIREVPVISEATIKRIEKSFQEMRTNAERAAESWKGWYDALAAVTKIIEAFKVPVPAPATRRPMAPHPEMLPRQAHPVGNHEKPAGAPSGGLRRMMIALAQRPHGLTSAQLGVRAGLSSRSGTFATYLSRGRQCGWITDEGDRKKITPNGILAIGSYQPLPEGRALLDHWLSELGGGAQRMLAALAEAYPVTTTSEDLGAAADISHASGTFATYLSKLRTLELIEGSNRALRISEELTE